jgi:hypothetical protein
MTRISTDGLVSYPGLIREIRGECLGSGKKESHGGYGGESR